MNRRTFLKSVGIMGSAFAMGGCAKYFASPSKAREKTRPNIVFILADDMGYGDPGCYNPGSKIPTPNMDRLAAEGIRFTDAHSPSSVCSPTRYGILTGRYAWRTDLKKGVLWAWDKPLIQKDRLTVAEMLKQHGYNTACIGKWHLGWDWPTKDHFQFSDQIKVGQYNAKARAEFCSKIDFTQPVKGGPLDHGFDYYFGDDVPNFPPYCFIENDRMVGTPSATKPNTMFGIPGPMRPGWKLEDVMPALTKKATEFICDKAKQSSSTPFFLFFTLTAPHTPIVPTDEFFGKSQAGRYGDYVCQVDWSIGQILKELKRNGIEDNTLVIVTSDNGSPARDGTNDSGPVGSVKKFGHNPSGKLRGLKSDAWEGGHRVPFIARWPGNIKAGSVSNETICLLDFMATTASILKVQLPDNAAEDSYDILPALSGTSRNEPIRPATIHHSGVGFFCIREGNWKLITALGSGGFSRPKFIKPQPDGPRGQLYNLLDDPYEQDNLWLQRQDIVKRLTNLLNRYKMQGYSRPLQKGQ